MPIHLAFFASHQGSNMQAVIDACKSGRLKARPCVVISNNGDSEALTRAKREGIPAYHLSSKTHPDPEQLDQTIMRTLVDHGTDLVLLAGYMKKLEPLTLDAFQGRILNIHPALLPKYGGQGMYGRNVHEAVLQAGETETGVTIHLVDGTYDHGAIVAQCRVPVEQNDTVETLSERVLKREHEFLVETLKRIMEGKIPLAEVGRR
jgi:phosphoribosylglycinamide formyltransferase-1